MLGQAVEPARFEPGDGGSVSSFETERHQVLPLALIALYSDVSPVTPLKTTRCLGRAPRRTTIAARNPRLLPPIELRDPLRGHAPGLQVRAHAQRRNAPHRIGQYARAIDRGDAFIRSSRRPVA